MFPEDRGSRGSEPGQSLRLMSGEAQVPGQTGRVTRTEEVASLADRPASSFPRPVQAAGSPLAKTPGGEETRPPPSGAGLWPAAVGSDLGPFLAARGGALCLFHSLCPLPAAGCRPSGGAEPVLSSTCAPGWRPGPPRSPLLVTSALRGPAEPVLASQPPVCGVRVTSGSGSEARPLTPPLGVRLARQTPREDGGHTAVLGTFWGVPLLETASLALA